MSRTLKSLVQACFDFNRDPVFGHRFVLLNAISKAKDKLGLDWSAMQIPVNVGAMSAKEFDQLAKQLREEEFYSTAMYCLTFISTGKRSDDVETVRQFAQQEIDLEKGEIKLLNRGQWLIEMEYILKEYEALPLIS